MHWNFDMRRIFGMHRTCIDTSWNAPDLWIIDQGLERHRFAPGSSSQTQIRHSAACGISALERTRELTDITRPLHEMCSYECVHVCTDALTCIHGSCVCKCKRMRARHVNAHACMCACNLVLVVLVL